MVGRTANANDIQVKDATMKQSILYALVSALLTALFLNPTAAFSQVAGDTGQTNVSLVATADLDLSTDRGRKVLDQRLRRAASEVCGPVSDADLEGRNDIRHCREEALARASADGSRLLAAARNGEVISVSASR